MIAVVLAALLTVAQIVQVRPTTMVPLSIVQPSAVILPPLIGVGLS